MLLHWSVFSVLLSRRSSVWPPITQNFIENQTTPIGVYSVASKHLERYTHGLIAYGLVGICSHFVSSKWVWNWFCKALQDSILLWNAVRKCSAFELVITDNGTEVAITTFSFGNTFILWGREYFPAFREAPVVGSTRTLLGGIKCADIRSLTNVGKIRHVWCGPRIQRHTYRLPT